MSTPLDLRQIHETTIHFEYFLAIAKEIARKLEVWESEDFFEWEESVYMLLEELQTTNVISFSERQRFESMQYSTCIYYLLKKLYESGYFSGNIEQVSDIKDTLWHLAESIQPSDIEQIELYYKTRYNALIEKDTRRHISNLTLELLEIARTKTFSVKYGVIDAIVDQLIYLDSQGSLPQDEQERYSICARRLTFQALSFLILWWHLHFHWELEERAIRYAKEYYLVHQWVEELQKIESYKANLMKENASLPDTITIKNTEKYPLMIEKYIFRTGKYIFEYIRFWKYDQNIAKAIYKFAKILLTEQLISPEVFEKIENYQWNYLSWLFLLQELMNDGYFESNEAFCFQITQALQTNRDIQGEITQQEVLMLEYNPDIYEKNEMLLSNVNELLDSLQYGDGLPHEHLDELLDFMIDISEWESTYCEYFNEEYTGIYDLENPCEKSYALMLVIFIDFLDEYFPRLDEVFQLLKNYFKTKEMQNLLEDIYFSYQSLNSKE